MKFMDQGWLEFKTDLIMFQTASMQHPHHFASLDFWQTLLSHPRAQRRMEAQAKDRRASSCPFLIACSSGSALLFRLIINEGCQRKGDCAIPFQWLISGSLLFSISR